MVDIRCGLSIFYGFGGFYPIQKQLKDTFYPNDLPEKKMLAYYGERFRTVEINPRDCFKTAVVSGKATGQELAG
jgi:hypothetical protein